MKQLYEKYRPKRLSQILGQDKAVATVSGHVARGGVGGRAYWISGKSGQGKTTLARCIAGMLADTWGIVEYDQGGDVDSAEVEKIGNTMGTFGWGRGGRAYIINEAHGLRSKAVVRKFLGLLERIPNHTVFIFTTTVEGNALFEDAQEDSGPLMSRCTRIRLTSQGLAPVFARLVKRVAQREGADGRPIKDYVALANAESGNCRAMFQAVESGQMRAQTDTPLRREC
jgi:replication-associated recombination protein RarA